MNDAHFEVASAQAQVHGSSNAGRHLQGPPRGPFANRLQFVHTGTPHVHSKQFISKIDTGVVVILKSSIVDIKSCRHPR